MASDSDTPYSIAVSWSFSINGLQYLYSTFLLTSSVTVSYVDARRDVSEQCATNQQQRDSELLVAVVTGRRGFDVESSQYQS